MFCVVCKLESTKYKCGNCVKYYCSVDCFKIHKKLQCNEVIQVQIQDKKEDNLKQNKTLQHYKTEDTVDIRRLKELEYNDTIKNILENRYLRTYLQEVDKAQNAWKAMKVAMQEPIFLEFANECYKIVKME